MADIHILDSYRDKQSLKKIKIRRQNLKAASALDNLNKVNEEHSKKINFFDMEFAIILLLTLIAGTIAMFVCLIVGISAILSIIISIIAGGLALIVSAVVLEFLP